MHARASLRQTRFSDLPSRGRRPFAGSLVGIALVGLLAGCSSVRTDEALAMLEVSAATEVQMFETFRFSVVARPEIRLHQFRAEPTRRVTFGYYLPGPNGPVRIRGEAVTAGGCVVGQGFADVDIVLGTHSQTVPLTIVTINGGTPVCPDPRDGGSDGGDAGGSDGGDAGGSDGGKTDVASDAHVDAPADTRTDAYADAHVDGPADVRPDTGDVGAPACFAVQHACKQAAECCAPLTCAGTVSTQDAPICCAGFNKSCTKSEGCCGELECESQKCCIPVGVKCSTNECCGGRVCAATVSSGSQKICCGNTGTACTDVELGRDCCGTLICDRNTRTCR